MLSWTLFGGVLCPALKRWSPLGPGLSRFDGGFDGSGSGPVGRAVLQQSATVWSIRSDRKTLQQHCR